jgi:hypothetical protein
MTGTQPRTNAALACAGVWLAVLLIAGLQTTSDAGKMTLSVVLVVISLAVTSTSVAAWIGGESRAWLASVASAVTIFVSVLALGSAVGS